MTPRSGDIWLVDLDPVVANEQAGRRPALVISVDEYHALPIRHAFVAPLTTRDRGLPHHVQVVDDGGLHRASFAMSEYARSLSTLRFRQRLASAHADTVDEVRRWVLRFLDE